MENSTNNPEKTDNTSGEHSTGSNQNSSTQAQKTENKNSGLNGLIRELVSGGFIGELSKLIDEKLEPIINNTKDLPLITKPNGDDSLFALLKKQFEKTEDDAEKQEDKQSPVIQNIIDSAENKQNNQIQNPSKDNNDSLINSIKESFDKSLSEAQEKNTQAVQEDREHETPDEIHERESREKYQNQVITLLENIVGKETTVQVTENKEKESGKPGLLNKLISGAGFVAIAASVLSNLFEDMELPHLGKGIADLIIRSLGGAVSFGGKVLTKIAPKLGEFGKLLPRILGPISKALKPILKTLPFISGAIGIMMGINRIKKGGVWDITQGIIDFLGAIGGFVPGYGTVLQLACDGINILIDILRSPVKDAEGKSTGITKGEAAWQWIKNASVKIGEFFMEKIFPHLPIVGTVQMVMRGIKGIKEGNLLYGLKDLILSPIGLVPHGKDFIDKIGTGIQSLKEWMEAPSEKVDESGNQITNAQNIKEIIKDSAISIGNWIFDHVILKLPITKSIFKLRDAFGKFKSGGIKNILGGIVDIFKSMGILITGPFVSVYDSVKTGIGYIKGLFETKVDPIPEQGEIKSNNSFMSSMISRVSELGKTAFNKIKSSIKNSLGWIGRKFFGSKEEAQEAENELLNNLSSEIERATAETENPPEQPNTVLDIAKTKQQKTVTQKPTQTPETARSENTVAEGTAEPVREQKPAITKPEPSKIQEFTPYYKDNFSRDLQATMARKPQINVSVESPKPPVVNVSSDVEKLKPEIEKLIDSINTLIGVTASNKPIAPDSRPINGSGSIFTANRSILQGA